uniref:Uncharacterized protein n=1 Tax=Anguilla anguilla TaxID=7936 RepID=A0A0E9TAC1_ANGAN
MFCHPALQPTLLISKTLTHIHANHLHAYMKCIFLATLLQ